MSTYEPNRPEPTDDTIDSRDVIYWIDALKTEFSDNTGDDPNEYGMSEDDWAVGLGWDDAEYLVSLLALAEEAESMEDWERGVTLVNEDYFTEYAEELATETGAIDREARWPLYWINWDAAADDLKGDYTSVSFGDATFWGRA